MTPYSVHPAAWQEMQDAQDYYQQISAVLARRWTVHLHKAIDLICQHPSIAPVYQGNIRRYVMQDFPMAVVYILSERYGVLILALAHQASKPKTYTNRLLKHQD